MPERTVVHADSSLGRLFAIFCMISPKCNIKPNKLCQERLVHSESRRHHYLSRSSLSCAFHHFSHLQIALLVLIFQDFQDKPGRVQGNHCCCFKERVQDVLNEFGLLY